MKKIQILFLIALIVTSFNFMRCSENISSDSNSAKLDTLSFTHSMKGWELYSWSSGNDWNYSILVGTNRAKSYNEVIVNKIAVVGKDSLKMLLAKFPAKEEIFWIGKGLNESWGDLSFPDNNTIDEIKNYCIQKELVLNLWE